MFCISIENIITFNSEKSITDAYPKNKNFVNGPIVDYALKSHRFFCKNVKC